jgi:Arc/MetJ-type ribon-helix-helix transcriptional regulator
MEVSLNLECEAIVNKFLASGMYKDASEVLGAALLRLKHEEEPWGELTAFLDERVAAVRRGEISSRSFDEIIADAQKATSVND